MTLSGSSTTSTRSSEKKTFSQSARTRAFHFLTPIQYVKGVGPRLGALLAQRGIKTVGDLLYFFPRDYENRAQTDSLKDIQPGENATIRLTIRSHRRVPLRRGRIRSMLEAVCDSETGPVRLKWFHAAKSLENSLQPGKRVTASGKVKIYMNVPEIIHPELSWKDPEKSEAAAIHFDEITPVYIEINGISTRLLRTIMWNALSSFDQKAIREHIPSRLSEKYNFPGLFASLRAIHFPKTAREKIDPQDLIDFNTAYHHRLIFEEFLKFELLILKRKQERKRSDGAHALDLEVALKDRADIEAQLPFSLTNDQKKALDEILKDLSQPFAMNRLIQGDVGSGKTIVSLIAAACIIAEGGQVALMAPTEILAEQHLKNAQKLLNGKISAELLTGSTKTAERKRILARLERGEPIIVIGTHALIEKPVKFKNLRLAMVDEQHRFGVEQRRALRSKGKPHILVLTATPIPRTLALTAYGDLSVSTIREKPPGRSAIITKTLIGSQRFEAIEKIRTEIKDGRQAYIIFPLVSESEAEGFTHLRSAIEEAEKLQTTVFPDFNVGVLHGRLSSEEKDEIMNRFKRHELDILVSTTVIEVGIDVPNATVMAIENAERFGLSQLHQLRGRVGRGKFQSYCFLLARDQLEESTLARLKVLDGTEDGFEISEADLKIRGPGEFMGVRQSGALPFKIADLGRDARWLLKAREDVESILSCDLGLKSPENAPLKLYLENQGKSDLERLTTS